MVIGAFGSPAPPTVDISPTNLRTHMASLDAWVSAMYSASVDDKAIVDCCLLDQDIAVCGEFALVSEIVHTYISKNNTLRPVRPVRLTPGTSEW